MKKNIFVLAFIFSVLNMYGQIYNEANSIMRKAVVLYSMDDKGFYQKKENVSLQIVENIVNSYAYDKKSHELYVETNNGNCIVTVNDNLAKILKKSKSIPQLKGEDLTAALNKTSQALAEKFERLNTARQKHIADSIQKAHDDSIKKAREDSIRLAKLMRQKEDYRKSHFWKWVPINKTRLSCSLCDKTVYSEDSLFCIGYKNDTLYHVTSEEMALEETYIKIHKMYVPPILKSNEKFRFHFEVYGDSLMSNNSILMTDPEGINSYSAYEALQKIKAKAPNGFFDDWGWGSEYGNVSFNFKYTNTNKKTIKYIEVFWVITNDVGDVRKTGSFKGTGPVEEWESGSWNWDYSMYYVAGDASKMNIRKVIITYMNGTSVTIQKNNIWYN